MLDSTAKPARNQSRAAAELPENKPELRLIKGGPRPKKQKQIAYTRFMNCLFDDVMPTLADSSWKVLCCIVRKTAGWDKEEDAISYSQIMAVTRIKSRTTVSKAIKELKELGCVDVVSERKKGSKECETNRYKLNAKFLATLLGNPEREQEVVHFLNRQQPSYWKKRFSEKAFAEHEYEDAKSAASRKFRHELGDDIYE